jgi:hypothetical protein
MEVSVIYNHFLGYFFDLKRKIDKYFVNFSLVQVRLLQTIKTENQLLLAFQLIGPFLQRIQTESTKLLLEVIN